MIVERLENKMIEDLIKHVQKEMITPANMGVFKKESRENVVKTLNHIYLNDFINIKSSEEYDKWFENTLIEFHQNLFPLYRENINVKKDNPYSYSARLLTQYIKFFCSRTYLFEYNARLYIRILHPIISNIFLEKFPKTGIKRVNGIQNQEDYYKIVKYYRSLFELDHCEENKPLLSLSFGIDF